MKRVGEIELDFAIDLAHVRKGEVLLPSQSEVSTNPLYT
jgi:hypothetical protein